jgi:Phosphodiester glycosidase
MVPADSAIRVLRVRRVLALSAGLLLSACAGQRVATPTADAFRMSVPAADSFSTETLAPGVVLHRLVRNSGPLRAAVLDIDLAACVTVRAVKGGATAVGRVTTTALLQSLPVAERPIAAVNADFFSFTPPGVPVGALIENGALIAGPIERPVIAFDGRNRPFIGALSISTEVSGLRGSLLATAWNRPRIATPGIVDAAWSQQLDSIVRPTARLLVPLGPANSPQQTRYRIARMPETHSGIVTGDTLVLLGRGTEGVPDGDTVSLRMTWSPVTPFNAVGGFPMLLRDSALVTTLDSAGSESFRGVNPRTAAGVGMRGRRLLLVVIDGRRPGYSVGTTTRQTAELLRELGAVDAVNLDGGGSTAMVVRDAVSGAIRLVNRPSDATGERPVANALAITGTCRAGDRPG